MDKLNKNNKCDEILIGGGVEWYRKKIIEMLYDIESIERLVKIHTVVKTHLKLQKGEI